MMRPIRASVNPSQEKQQMVNRTPTISAKDLKSAILREYTYHPEKNNV
jgi:hypothetical protein